MLRTVINSAGDSRRQSTAGTRRSLWHPTYLYSDRLALAVPPRIERHRDHELAIADLVVIGRRSCRRLWCRLGGRLGRLRRFFGERSGHRCDGGLPPPGEQVRLHPHEAADPRRAHRGDPLALGEIADGANQRVRDAYVIGAAEAFEVVVCTDLA